ncbi:MAG: MarR family transcriptional regulator [Actinobacteria bacterium]|nr:MarR family transcriptional regulator [Actinomycetota bacterium]
MESTNFTYVIKQVELALRPYFNEVCVSAGLTPAQYTALTVLERRPGLTSSELARRSFVRAQTMAATIEPLLADGLVRREQDPTHRRRMLLDLTPLGAERLKAVAPRIRAVENLIVAELDEDARQNFARYLRSARHSLDTSGPRPSGRKRATD